ncbi:MAG: hypothetical protein JRJ42_00385 [Deltaproteobacteria bacterium]|nr:hypothetical protein [Deltaproteobacteria bacterium]MBW2018453.1 hypothetical protein [Deltaproteobacteria bacterium]MBW2073740.1 hypothetical protein [Deltaproteobacteria bacterium]
MNGKHVRLSWQKSIAYFQGSSSRRSRPSRPSIYLFLAIGILILGNLVPLWSFTYFPSFDHPAHLLRQNILANYNNPQFDYNQHFVIQRLPVPNSLSDYIVVFLAQFIPLGVASKIFYSLLFVFFPLSLLYYLYAVRPGNCYLALSGCLFSYNYLLLIWGNENFCLSIPLFFIIYGYWWTHKDHLGAREYTLLSCLWSALYFSHILGFALLMLSIFFTSLIESRSLRKSALAVLPSSLGVIMYIWWNFHRGEYFDNPIIWNFKISDKLHSLREVFFFGEKIGFPPYLQFGMLLFLVCYSLLFLSFLVKGKREVTTRGILFNFFLLLLLVLLLPNWFILFGPDQRTLIVALFFGLPLLLIPSRTIKGIFAVFLVVFSLYYNVVIFGYFSRENQVLSEHKVVLDKIPPLQKLLPLVLPPYTFFPAYHRFFEYYHLEKGGINPFHATQPIFSVDYVKRPPSSGIYNFSVKDLSPTILSYYDFILVVGNKDDMLHQTLERMFLTNGYKLFYKYKIYTIFNRQ